MAVALVVTRGFGNGTLTGTIAGVTMVGYISGTPPPASGFSKMTRDLTRDITRPPTNDNTG